MNILHSNRRWVCVGMAAAFAVVLSVGSSSAETLSELLPDFLDNHNLSK
ncbi:MAG: hypothetical protein HOL66_12580, partial [Rhodospirillaceae bacterium]|nr:hypothetical protein [Rhodospirillaceae bacterium]MBT5562365.1 hypothetical protein [Rhodospirillaceae bacterium]MBT6240987.1 hypothetical protein [Rhodospirillaceae bacterium]